jgi:hypothetical protein
MERLGFSHDERDDFDHPEIKECHELRRHVAPLVGLAVSKITSLSSPDVGFLAAAATL